ncbi:MAG TPA: Holliday junction resolvase [Pyrodictium sp.]|nr:Holliday junction resolvase [Pyrodictium sp.]HIQ56240.1 Holliday junction resolvase [Pyrodictium sp.]
MRGFEAERDLARRLWQKGFAVIRAPASGAKAKHYVYPDLVAIWRGKILVFEVKRRTKLTTLYIDAKQVEKLREFCRRAGGEAFIAIKIVDEKKWYFVPLTELEQIETGKYRISAEKIRSALTLEELVKRYTMEALDKYIQSGK